MDQKKSLNQPPADHKSLLVNESAIGEIILQQLEIMRQQLEALKVSSAQSELHYSPTKSEPVVTVIAPSVQKDTRLQENSSNFSPPDRMSTEDTHLEGRKAEDTSPGSVLKDKIPLTEAQREIWLASRLSETASCAFNESTVLHLRGFLDTEALKAALSGLVHRYEALRTTFDSIGEYQQISPSGTFELSVFDYSTLADSPRQKTVFDILNEEARKPFDLEHGPLYRAKIIKISDEYHMLVTTAHHIVCDGWSFDVMTRDLSQAYNLLREGRSDDRPLPAMQISDYALWQEKAKDSPEVLSAEKYWIQQFADPVPVLEFPSDRPRPPVKSYRGARETKILDESIYAQIKKIGAKQGATLFSTLLSAYVVLLHRLTGQEDLVVGILAAGQSAIGIDDLVGHCTNLLPLHVRINGGETFGELLARVKNLVLDAYDNQAVTFGSLINKLKLKRDPSRTPLVSVMFNIDPAIHGMEFNGLEMEYVSNPRCAFQFDMGFNLTAYDKKLISECDYTTDLFEAETIDRWLGHYHTLIANIVQNPEQPISTIPILADSERHELLVEWNATQEVYPVVQTLGQLFEEQASRTPDAVAIICKGVELTYSELNIKVNQLASYLRELDIGPDIFVGLCLERSIDMVIGLLGILKAGGAYIPLDPGFPKDRLQFMLEDSGASVLITQGSFSGDLSGYQGKVVYIDSDWTRIEKRSPENLGAVGTPENLAYLIYTSGSTGRPKGVQISHRAVINFLFSMRRQPGLSSEDTILSVTTVSFDIFGLELFLPLITGAKVVLAGWEDALDGVRLIELLRESGASVMQATPATWRLLMQAGWEGAPSLRIFCGGEALPRDLVGPLLDRGKEFWNLYGPTETTIWSTVYQIKSKEDPILIGRPIANTQVYILDNTLQPVPIGVSGELHIGGDGLARGYWNNPELTAEKFIPHPFNKDTNERIYKTGDLARYHPDGNIECLGRIDQQVKVRGFRIELGEIETLLNQNPSIKQSAVVTGTDPLGENQLMAYIVSKNDQGPDVRDLRKYLREALPEYMVPSRFSFLEAMPLTPNGKIDRKALSAIPAPKEDNWGSTFVAANDPLEMQLTKIWESVLGIKTIGIRDDFFEIGGNSLLAARLFSKINKLMGLNLPLATLFQAPTIELLARSIRDKDWKTSWSCLVPIQPGGSKPLLFFVHGAGGNVLLYRDLATHLGADQPFYGLQAQGLDGQRPHLTCFEDMAAQYINEVRSLQPEGPYFLGGYCLGGALALEMAQQLFVQGQEVALLAMIETYNVRAKTNRLPFYYDYFHQLQNLKFHWDNLRLLNRKDQIVFLSKKSRVSWGRMKLMFSIASSSLTQMLRMPLGEKYPHINLTKINDQANLEYFPKSYQGKITLFRPKKHFAGCKEYDFGWGGLAQGGVEVHVLPVNPRGVLVEPFVREFARELKSCIEKISGR